jgi:hypothetical protein
VFEAEGEVDLTWWTKPGAQSSPELPASGKTVAFEDYSLTVRTETETASKAPLVVSNGGQIKLAEEDADRNVKPALDRFSTILNEVIISVDEFAEIIMEYDQKDWINLVGLSAHSTKKGQALDAAFDISEDGYSIQEYVGARKEDNGDELQPQLEFHVDWNLPNHKAIEPLTTDTRFDHMQGMEISTGLRVPVDITTSVAVGLEEDPGQPIHTGENMVEFTDLQPVNIQDEVARIDFQELLHHNEVYPDKPESWPLENPLSIVPDSFKQEFEG